MSLKRLQECLDELNTTNSMTAKKIILASYEDLKKYFIYAHDPDMTYGITSAALTKAAYMEDDCEIHLDIFSLLDDLASRKITGHEAHNYINHFIAEYPVYADIVHMMLDKNLKVRLGVKQINQVWPGSIKEFKVALAEKYKEFIHRVTFGKYETSWYISRKLDGVRCIIIVGADGNIKAWTRTGKPIETLGLVIEEIKKLDLRNTVFDGEICIIDDHGNEDFASVMKQIRKKKHVIQNPRYMIFDMLTLDEFEGKKKSPDLTKRILRYEAIGRKNTILKPLNQRIVHSVEDLEDFFAAANKKGWEGAMLRKDVPYEGKRTQNLLKLKKFHDAEFTVTRIKSGPFRIINKITGLEDTITTMTKAIIMYRDNEVGVGSGWSLEQRQEYHYNPGAIIGNLITVQYFEETRDQKTKQYSLRFPTVKHVHGKTRGM